MVVFTNESTEVQNRAVCMYVYVTGSEKTTLIARVVLCSSGGFKAKTVALSISFFSRILVKCVSLRLQLRSVP